MEPKDVIHGICQNYILDRKLDLSLDATLYSKLNGYVRSRSVSQLAECSSLFDVALHDVEDFRTLRQVEAFYRKNSLFANTKKCREAAYKSFFENELQCSLTNRRLRDVVTNLGLLDQPLGFYIREMRSYISRILGPFTSFQQALPSLVRVTSGATSLRTRRRSLPQQKMTLRPYVTKGAEGHLRHIYEVFGFHDVEPRRTTSNRIELVPKNWRTSRTIACEPEGNLPLQLAFDEYAKRRLRRFGIDLSNQSSSIERARIASVTGSDATIDMKAASDTVAYNTPLLLFPDEWCSYLLDVRTPFYHGEFGQGTYAKFSSMGNGTTFCIETLIFAAACYAVNGNYNFLVYGDDVILPRESYRDFTRLIGFLGFTVNSEKTFVDGPFRESCGGDFYDGENVTPVYVRKLTKSKSSLCHLVNTIRGISLPGGRLWKQLDKIIIQHKLPYVPYDGDTMSGVWIKPDTARAKGILVGGSNAPKRLRRYQAEWYKAYLPKVKRRPFRYDRGYYLWFLHANNQVRYARPWEPTRTFDEDATRTSEATIYEHKYVRRWVRWSEPPEGSPWFTEYAMP